MVERRRFKELLDSQLVLQSTCLHSDLREMFLGEDGDQRIVDLQFHCAREGVLD